MDNRGISMASGLLVVGTRYYYRMRVPDNLVGKMAKKEFRVSLRTGDKREAKRLSCICGSMVREFFEKVRRGDTTVKKLKPEEVGYLVAEWLKKIVSDAEDRRNSGRFPVEVRRTMDEDHTDAVLEMIGHLESDDREALWNLEHIKWMKQDALRLLGEKRLNADDGTFGKLCREMLKARCHYWEYERERVENPLGDEGEAIQRHLGESITEGVKFVNPLVENTPAVSTVQAQSVASATQSIADVTQDVVKKPSLSEIVEEYIDFKTSEGEWRKRTVAATVPRLRRFVELIGNPRADTLTRDALKQYRAYLVGSPAQQKERWKKYSKIPEKKLEGMILRGEIPEADRISRGALNTYITQINSFLKWATVQHDIPGWACQIIQRVKASSGGKVVSAEESMRRAFTEKEIRTIFSQSGFTEDGFTRSWYFWVPLIALFSGARVGEIGQMRIDDVREAQSTAGAAGVLCFDINDKEDKLTKNATSIRLVPVHPMLVEIGLKEYMERLRKRGETLLFPELEKRSKSTVMHYGETISHWFSKFKRGIGVGGPMNEDGEYNKDGKEATFHSFRNTFITECQRNRLELSMIQQLVGHSKGATMTDRYTDRYSPMELYEGVIRRVEFPVDVERLKRSRFGKWIRD